MSNELELTFDLTEELKQEKQEEKKKVERVKKATKKKKASDFEPTWEQVWNGYTNPYTNKYKKGIWELKDSKTTHREWLQEVKDAVEDGTLELIDPVTKEPIPMKKFSKSKAKELHAVLEKLKREQRIKEMIENKPENYYCITTEEQMEQLVKDLEDEIETGLDTETTGLDVYVDVMVGISITLPKNDYHVYIPFGHTTGEKQLPRDYVLQKLRPYLFNEKTVKFLHNAKFDKHMFIRHGYDIKGRIHDTQIAQKLLNENEQSNRLKDLLTKYKRYLGFEEDSYTFEQLFGKNAPFHEVPLDIATVYACKDTHGCYLLGKWQETFFKKMSGLHNIFYNIESPLLPTVVDMEQTGMLLDMEFAEEYGKELDQYLKELHEEILTEMGDININSPQQLAHWLYDERGLEDITGQRKTDKGTLKQLADEEPILKKLLEYKDLFKLYSTYISALPEKVKSDGRIHGQFNQDKTDTGRFSSQDPNLQNLPSRARRMVVAPDGYMIVSIDFSQIEPRFLSHISGDEGMREPYLEGYDLYSTLASRVFKVPIEQCGDGSIYRKHMKTGLLAVMYGTSMFTLSKQLGISVDEAEQFIDDFYKAYPKVEAWIKSVHEFVKQNEYVETAYGRKRRFPNHKQKAIQYDKLYKQICKILGTNKVPVDFWNKEKYPKLPYKLKRQFQNVKGSVERVRRQAVNAVIQGSSADIMKMAMLRVDEYCKKKGWRLMGTVHDEVLILVDRNATHEELIELDGCMRGAVQLEVPLKTDVELQLTWGNGFKFDVSRKVFFLMNEKTGETIFETPDLDRAFELYKEVA